jgi:predicted methyltransferase
MKSVDEKHLIAKKILTHLVQRPMRLRDVWKLAIQDSAGVNKSITVLYWLRDKEYIRKTGDGHHDPYEITDKGRALLACI